MSALFDSEIIAGAQSVEVQLAWRERSFKDASGLLSASKAKAASTGNNRLLLLLSEYKRQEDHLLQRYNILQSELAEATGSWSEPNMMGTLPQHDYRFHVAGKNLNITTPVTANRATGTRVQSGVVSDRQNMDVDVRIQTLRAALEPIEKSLNRLEHIIRSLDLRATRNLVENAKHARMVYSLSEVPK
jgi:chaperonin cofactor prefoldin